jgi:hypothetical protein
MTKFRPRQTTAQSPYLEKYYAESQMGAEISSVVSFEAHCVVYAGILCIQHTVAARDVQAALDPQLDDF